MIIYIKLDDGGAVEDQQVQFLQEELNSLFMAFDRPLAPYSGGAKIGRANCVGGPDLERPMR